MGITTKKTMMLKKYWPFVVILSVWFIFASPYFFKGLVPFPSKYLVTFFPPWNTEYGMPVKNNAMPDIISQIYPWKKITIDSWKQGQVPLWNPYSFSGTPHAANYQTAVFSPVNLLYFILPFLDAWSVSILLQPLLVGMFMYFFLRCLLRSQQASLLGSLAFMFCGFLTVWMAYGTLGWSVLWLPLLFASVVRHMDKRSWWNIVIISVSLAWSFFSGHFQMSMFVFIALSAFIVIQVIHRKQLRAGIEVSMAVIFGLMMSAPQILPSLDAYSHSMRSELFNQTGGIAWNYLVTLFAPDFFGNPVTRNDWFGFYAEWASYIGVIPLLLAIYVIIRGTREVRFYLGLAIVTLLIATPSPLNSLVSLLKIPAISTSYAARIIILTSFSLTVMSAYGLDTLREDWMKKRSPITIRYIIGVGLFLVFLWGIIFIVRPFPIDELIIAKRNLVFPTGLAIGFCIVVMAGFFKRWKFIQHFSMGILIVITALDMLRYAVKWMPFDPREYVYPEVDILSFLKKNVGFERIFGNLGGEVTNAFAFFGIEGYDAVYQKRYGEFIRATSEGKIITPERSVVQFAKIATYSEQVLQLLGVRYLVHRLSDGRSSWAYPYWQYPYYQSVYRNGQYEVFESQKALPRAYLASSYIVRTNDQSILDTLYSENFEPKETIVLEEEPELSSQWGNAHTEITKYTPNEVLIKTNATGPKLLFLSDSFDTGWKAAIDGEATKIYRADYDFRAVAVPQGEHTIRMVYWPDSFVYGLWAWAVAVVLLTAMVVRIKKL